MAEKKTAKKAKRAGTYRAMLHEGGLSAMGETELLAAIHDELNSPRPRTEMLVRMASRFNRLRGDRFTKGVMGLLGAKGRRDLAGLT